MNELEERIEALEKEVAVLKEQISKLPNADEIAKAISAKLSEALHDIS